MSILILIVLLISKIEIKEDKQLGDSKIIKISSNNFNLIIKVVCKD